jgi:hypothetical protein
MREEGKGKREEGLTMRRRILPPLSEFFGLRGETFPPLKIKNINYCIIHYLGNIQFQKMVISIFSNTENEGELYKVINN